MTIFSPASVALIKERMTRERSNIHTYRMTWNIPDGPPGTREQDRFAANCMTGVARGKAKKLLRKLMNKAPKDWAAVVKLTDETLGVSLGFIVAMNGVITRDWERS